MRYLDSLMVRVRVFWQDRSGATAIEYSVLAALVSLTLVAALALTGDKARDMFDAVAAALVSDRTSDPAWSSTPDADLARRPWSLDHQSLWVAPFGGAGDSLPAGLIIGGQPFQLIGDGNPRLLVEGADPGSAGRYDASNYASSGVAFGTGQTHRLMIDRPAPNQTYTVQLHVNGQVVQYALTAPPS